MTEKTKKALKDFAIGANLGGANPIDWDRLYKFSVVAFLENDKRITFDEFYRFICKTTGKDILEETVSDYFVTYSRCMDFADKLKLEFKGIEWE
ncbi:MAG: hypothetical protein GF387_01960 [Candidatus Portnoybacteria bacterium]|nr:hypothetical protein [Candidatus Portnoybacteria bacterium]